MSAARAERVVAALHERGLDGLAVTDLVDVRWLTGFTGTNGACLLTPDDRLLLTDFRYLEQAAAQVEGIEVVRAGRDLLGELAGRLPDGRVGFDDGHLSVRAHARLSERAAAGVELVAAGEIVKRLREVKDAGEQERIAAAAELATAVFERILAGGLAGRAERAVALELEHELRLAGAEDPSFPAIVAAGPHGALPHATPRDEQIPRDALVTIDWGARLDGYCSDCTRTVATGSVGDREREVYELVRRAQQAALDAVAPGIGYAELDAVARTVIAEAGHADAFGHGLGHGVGLEVHEAPRIAKGSEGQLAAGQVVTVEPGVYLPGDLGVRIEDLVVVGDPPRVLTSFAKELVEVS